MKFSRFAKKSRRRKFLIGCLIIILAISAVFYLITPITNTSEEIIRHNDFYNTEFGDFVEKDFPFITTVLDNRNIGARFPKFNVVARGLAINLGNDSYACFDMDLLRWSVAWEGKFISLVLPAQGSYNDFFRRNNNELPVIVGTPQIANGMYAGWSVNQSNFKDVRPDSQKVEGMYWGPISENYGRWNGTFVIDSSVLLSYNIAGVNVLESPSSTVIDNELVFIRTFKIGHSSERLILNVAQVNQAVGSSYDSQKGFLIYGGAQDSVTAVVYNGNQGQVKILDNQYITVEIDPSEDDRTFSVFIWNGKYSNVDELTRSLVLMRKNIPDPRRSHSHWAEKILTRGQISPDTAAFVADNLTLPIPNPWRRNIRVADIAFFSNNRAAVSTYEGDIWLVDGIDKDLEKLSWKRYASGLYEPMSIEIYRDQIYAFGREGIIRFHDLNGDDEADYYENFCNLPNQSTGTREWPADMVVDKEGNFYIAKGGHLTGFKGILPYYSTSIDNIKWRSSSIHSGSVIKIDSSGKNMVVIATGFRMPYLGINKATGLLSASDQEGNYVPASGIRIVKAGDYFGVPVTSHISNKLEKSDTLKITEALTWIPHYVDRSSASQVWVNSDQMGPLNHGLLHFSFGRPGIFRVLFDTVQNGFNGGVVSIEANYLAPVMKGEMSPHDGQLYFAGFNNYTSNSQGISALMRLRYTGKISHYVKGFKAGYKGIVVQFDSPLSGVSIQAQGNYQVRRWNYKRTSDYGSPPFKLDGTVGYDNLRVLAAFPSSDRSALFLYIPDMKESDQIEINYDLRTDNNEVVKGGIWMTISKLDDIDFSKLRFPSIDFEAIKTDKVESDGGTGETEISIKKGKELFNRFGCSGCHSTGESTQNHNAPNLQGIFGKEQQLSDGRTIIVDTGYIRESIIDPWTKIVGGYENMGRMPPFNGVLSDREISSIILYIRSLTDEKR